MTGSQQKWKYYFAPKNLLDGLRFYIEVCTLPYVAYPHC